MISKDNYMAEKLRKHLGHHVEIVTYGMDTEDGSYELHDVCLECTDCNEVIISAEDYEEEADDGEDDGSEQLRMPEIGNLLFGNSRGEYPIINRTGWEETFYKYFVETGYFDSYGFYNGKRYDLETDRGGYESDVFILNPYYWGEDEDIAKLPNFVYKPTGFEIQWYKYFFRDSYKNQDVSLEEAEKIFAECLKDLEGGK